MPVVHRENEEGGGRGGSSREQRGGYEQRNKVPVNWIMVVMKVFQDFMQ